MPERSSSFLDRCVQLPAATLIALVKLYQRTVSPALPVFFGPACGCRFTPTCSHYAIEALRTRGAVVGTGLSALRLLKCTPLHPGGEDLVPARRARPRCHAPTGLIASPSSPLS